MSDAKIVAMALSEGFFPGVLSSRVHVAWASATGARSGVGNDSNYNHSECFAKFPFPICGEAEKERIRKLAEELDAHRKRVQAQHGLTLTGLYNVLEKLRAGSARSAALSYPNPLPLGEGTAMARPGKSVTPDSNPALETILPLPAGEGRGEGERFNNAAASITLTANEKQIHDQGLVSVVKQLHDDLDAAVFAAYGWPATLTDAEILERLVTLNAGRAVEEKRGVIHWLRPDYQAKGQKAMILPERQDKPAKKTKAKTAKSLRKTKSAWPKGLAERVQVVEAALHTVGAPVAPADLAKQFKRAKPADVAEILQTLVTLGRARKQGGQFTR